MISANDKKKFKAIVLDEMISNTNTVITLVQLYIRIRTSAEWYGPRGEDIDEVEDLMGEYISESFREIYGYK